MTTKKAATRGRSAGRKATMPASRRLTSVGKRKTSAKASAAKGRATPAQKAPKTKKVSGKKALVKKSAPRKAVKKEVSVTRKTTASSEVATIRKSKRSRKSTARVKTKKSISPRVRANSSVTPAIAVPQRLNTTRGLAFLLAVAALMSGGLLIKSAMAATFQGPSSAPPGGNIPVTIWNREASGSKQANASVEIDGYLALDETLAVGTEALDLGSGAGGQNVLYAVADFTGFHGGDALLLLQTETGGTYTDRFRVNKWGSLTLSGALSTGEAMFVGTSNADLNASTVGQNLLYGVARYEFMHPTGDNLLKLQTYTGGVYTDRMVVNREGDVTSSGCFGPTLVGLTSATYAAGVAPVLSYYGANNQCAAAYAGSHVCTAEELLRSISCSAAGDPVRTLGGQIAWINGGPPGFTSNANDCIGWTTNAATSYGRYWSFDNTTGGYGTMTSCNAPGLKFACCQ